MAPLQQVDPVSVFRWSLGGEGLETFLGLPPFPSRAAAKRAWARVRRQMWSQTSRFRVPPSATAFDGVTTRGLEHLDEHWNADGPYPLADTLAALALDRKALATFAATRAAVQIADHLQMFAEDLDTLERVARHLATYPPAELFRPYPIEVREAGLYGGPAARPPVMQHDDPAEWDGPQ